MTKHFYFSVLILLFLSCTTLVNAQQNAVDKSNYSLFWKIEKDSLSKPSYLFGTMHVKDKRCFEFTDDFLQAMHDADILALELDFDSVYTKMFTKTMKEAEHDRFMEEFFDDEEFEVIEEEAIKKGISLRNLPRKDLRTLDLFLDKPDIDEVENMPVFLDAYLFYLAKSYEKKIVGLEKYEDQIELYNNLPKEITKEIVLSKFKEFSDGIYAYERLIEIYLSGDIGKIDEFMDYYSDEYRESFLTKRNINMVEELDSYLNNNSVFTAVGAAHLAGDYGIIELLRKKGYTLTAMPAVFTEKADSLFDIGLKPDSWETYVDSSTGFSLNVPFKPINYEGFGGILNMKLCMDFMQGPFYYFYGIPNALAGLEEGNENLVDVLSERFKESMTADIVNKKSFIYKGARGAEMILKSSGDIEFKVKVVVINKHMYLMMVGNTKKDYNSIDAERFFNSLSFFPSKNLETASGDWEEYTFDDGAFTIQMPSKPNYQKQESSNPGDLDGENYIVHMYYGMDINNEQLFFVQWYDLPPGFIYENDSDVFQQFFSSLVGADFVFDPAKMDALSVLGAIGYESPQTIESKGLKFKFRIFLRGNRSYFLLAQVKENAQNNERIERFFNSFKTIPFHQGVYTLQSVEIMKTLLPGKVVLVEEDDGSDYFSGGISSSSYACLDKYSGLSFVFTINKYPKYYRIKHIDSFLLDMRNHLIGYRDELIDSSAGTTKQNDPYVGGTIKSELTENRIKLKFIQKENYVIEMYAYVTDEMISDPLLNKAFGMITIDSFIPGFDIFSSKADLIIRDIKSADTSIYKAARKALSYYEFDSIDLSLLHNALLYSYPDSAETYNNIKYKIISQLSSLNDDSTLVYVSNCYNKDYNSSYAGDLLTLVNTLSDNNPQVIFSLLREHTPGDLYYYQALGIISPILDSAEFFGHVFHEMLSLCTEQMSLQSAISYLLFSNWDSLNLNDEQQKLVLNSAINWYNISCDSIHCHSFDDIGFYTFETSIANIIKLFSKLEYDDFDKLLVKIKDIESAEINSAFILFNLGQKRKISSKTWKKAIEDEYYGFELICELSDQHMLDKVPRKYTTNLCFAEMALKDYFLYDDYLPEIISFKDTVSIIVEEKKYIFYVFECKWAKDSDEFIAISGGFEKSEKNINMDMLWVDYDYEDINEKRTKEISLKSLLDGARVQIEE